MPFLSVNSRSIRHGVPVSGSRRVAHQPCRRRANDAPFCSTMRQYFVALLLPAAVSLLRAQRVDWPTYAGDAAATKFSAAAAIDRANVTRLTIAWEWKAGETPVDSPATRPGTFQTTPLVVNDTMYLSTPFNRVVALDARTGSELWRYDPRAYAYGQPPNGTGFVHRGVAMWTDGRRRVL